METGLACASSSIAPLPRRCYNYSGVNSLPGRRKTRLSPASLRPSPACRELPRRSKKKTTKNPPPNSCSHAMRRKRSLNRAASASTYGKYLIIKPHGEDSPAWRRSAGGFSSMTDGLCLAAQPAAVSPSLVPAGDTSFASFLEPHLPITRCFRIGRSSPLIHPTWKKLRSPAACRMYFGVLGMAKLPKSSHPALSHHVLLQCNLAGISLGEKQEKRPNSTTGLWDALGAASRARGWDGKACARGLHLIARAEAKSAGNGAFLGLQYEKDAGWSRRSTSEHET